MRVVFYGTPGIAVPTLEALCEAGHDVVLVISRPDKPAGRRMQITTPPVIGAARRLALASAQPRKVGDDAAIERLRALAPEVAVVVAYGRLLPPALLAVPTHGFVNLHPSLLPRHRGPSPIAWAVASGDVETGVSTMLLDEGMDTGPILLQRATAIGPRERTPSLEKRLGELGAGLVVETLAGLAEATLVPRPQDDRLASVTPKLERSMGRIDWSRPSVVWNNRVRAFDPWPGLYCRFRDARVKVHGLEVAEPQSGNEDPGVILSAAPEGITVRCGSGTAALLTELQREGKRRIPADAFIIGERVARGERFS